MRRWYLAIVSLAVGCGLVSCEGGERSAQTGDDRRVVAVTQIATHPGIDAVRQGFIDQMVEEGYVEGETIDYDFSNANGDFIAAQAISQRLSAIEVDAVFSISTPSTQAIAAATQGTEIPVIFGAITDPVAAGVVASFEEPGGNVTGTSDIWPIGDQFELLVELVPSVRRVGVMANPSEVNSQASMVLVRQEAERLGLELIEISVASSGDVSIAARSLVGRVDAIYIPADNTVISALGAVVAVAEEADIPLLPGDTSNVEIGGFGTIGHDYYSIGQESARMMVEVLDGADPATTPVRTSPNYQYYFNVRSAREMGVEIPQQLIDRAAVVYE